jgi:O-antigen ligase
VAGRIAIPATRISALGALAIAAAAGVLAGSHPLLAVAFAAGAALLLLMLQDLVLGVYALAFLGFTDALPTFGVLSGAKLVGLVVVIAWLATMATRGTDEELFSRHPLLIAGLSGFLAWAALSSVWAESASASLTALSRYVPNLVLIPIVYSAVRTRRQFGLLLGVIVGSAAIAASFGIVHPPANPSATSGDVARATGTAGDANVLAAVLVAGAAIAAGFALRASLPGMQRLLAAGAAGMCLLGIFLSLSRGGLVALVVSLLVAMVVGGRWRLRVVLVAFALALAGVVYFTQVASLPSRERISSIGGGGTGRVDLWTVGGRMVAAHPVRGIGVGNFQTSSIHYLLQSGAIQRDDFIIETPKVAHNTYLQVLAELGIVGAALFAGILLFCLSCMLRAAGRFARKGHLDMEIHVRTLFVGLVGLLTADFFISEMYSKLLWLLLALGPALLAMSARAEDRSAPRGQQLAIQR